MLSSCAVYPRFSKSSAPKQCKVFTKEIELDFFGVAVDCRGMDSGETCLTFLGAVAGVYVSSVIISSSIYVVGNTIRYLEQKARCDDATLLEDRITEFSYKMKELDAKKIELEELKNLQAQKLADEQKEIKVLELKSKGINVKLDKVGLELDQLEAERKELQSELKGLN